MKTFEDLYPLDVYGARTLVGFLNFEFDLVTFSQIVEVNSNQTPHVEKQVFRLAFPSNEAVAFVGKFLYNTFHLFNVFV